VSGRDDLDLYGRGARPDRPSAGRWIAGILGVLVGVAVSLYGVALYALRCFDTCPTDPSLDRATQLLAAAVILFGAAVALGAALAGTRWAAGAAAVVTGFGVAIAAAGALTLAFVPSIDDPGGYGVTPVAGVVALAAGGVVTAAGAFGRRAALRRGD
jgi:hypothetical protein